MLKTIEQIKASDAVSGKALTGLLHECKSIQTGHNGRLRIVFSLRSNQLLQLIVAGPRERGIVYIQAVQVLKELER